MNLLKKLSPSLHTFRYYSDKVIQPVPQVCIIGSGPAGFYTAQQVLKSSPFAKIDIYERLPVPFGLVRYGVAPDHPEVKNVINTFTKAAKDNRVSFYGNITIGSDVTFSQLKNAYHVIVLAYGAAKDKMLEIPGESLPNVISSKSFVGWYNGLPQDSGLKLNLDVEEAVIVGHGNVALDIARLLLTPVDTLKKTDIPEPVLDRLVGSRIKRVHLIGRRQSHQASFTVKELRELINLEGARLILQQKDVYHIPELLSVEKFSRAKKRMLELLHKSASSESEESYETSASHLNEKTCLLRFLLSPQKIIGCPDQSKVEKLICSINSIVGDIAVPTDHLETIECGLVVRSIGYTSVRLDDSIPFDKQRGLVPNVKGRVLDEIGLYASGWVASGPVGVIASTMQSGHQTGFSIVKDINDGIVSLSAGKRGYEDICEILKNNDVKPVTFEDWTQLDRYEIEEGNKRGKPREKVTEKAKMLNIAHGNVNGI